MQLQDLCCWRVSQVVGRAPNRFITDDSIDPDKHRDERDCIPCKNGSFSNPGARYCDVCPAGFVSGIVASKYIRM